jgi:hypothetical protein
VVSSIALNLQRINLPLMQFYHLFCAVFIAILDVTFVESLAHRGCASPKPSRAPGDLAGSSR